MPSTKASKLPGLFWSTQTVLPSWMKHVGQVRALDNEQHLSLKSTKDLQSEMAKITEIISISLQLLNDSGTVWRVVKCHLFPNKKRKSINSSNSFMARRKTGRVMCSGLPMPLWTLETSSKLTWLWHGFVSTSWESSWDFSRHSSQASTYFIGQKGIHSQPHLSGSTAVNKAPSLGKKRKWNIVIFEGRMSRKKSKTAHHLFETPSFLGRNMKKSNSQSSPWCFAKSNSRPQSLRGSFRPTAWHHPSGRPSTTCSCKVWSWQNV